MFDLRKEKDIERLRQVAVLLDSQIKHLFDVLASKCSELDRLKGTGREMQLALGLIERIPLVCDLDCADRTCPCCGKNLKVMEGQFERSEMIDLVDITYHVAVVERRKYVCNCGSVVETAPAPERAVDGGRYSLPFGVKVTFDKFLNHLPLQRQVRMMGQHGLDVSSQTLWDQTCAVSRLYLPTYEEIKRQLWRRR